MPDDVQYSVRDSYGNTYGPASAELLRQWVREGRIIAGMTITTAGADTGWTEISTHPAVADLFSGTPRPVSSPVPQQVEAVRVEYAHPSTRINATSGTAITSLILGIISFLGATPSYFFGCCCCGAIPFALVGLFLGFLALGQARTPGSAQSGKAMAIAGIILSALALLYMTVGFLLLAISGTWTTHFHAGHL
jgi:Domain of unknown function (DUF4190)